MIAESEDCGMNWRRVSDIISKLYGIIMDLVSPDKKWRRVWNAPDRQMMFLTLTLE